MSVTENLGFKRGGLFRSQALKHYMQDREKDILPRFVAPPMFLFLWTLIGLLLITLGIAWFGEVPQYVTGNGLILEQQAGTQVALLFFPVDPASPFSVRVGTPVHLRLEAGSKLQTHTVTHVEPGIIGPEEAQQRYQLGRAETLVITGPSIAVFVSLEGTQVRGQTLIQQAQLELGSRRLLTLVPGLGQWFGA
jgi:hypothetical protein